MIKVLYFARLREALKSSGEELAIVEPVSVSQLMAQLASRGGAWVEEFGGGKPLRAAVNQELVGSDAEIKPGDEVAFFPPVTGG